MYNMLNKYSRGTMKKLLVICLIFSLILSVHTFAIGKASLKCTVFEEDLSGTNYRLYLGKCSGHYSNDTVTIYITNTSDENMKFQVMIGYSGSSVQTTVESGYVEIPSGVTGRFVLTELSKYYEKTNDTLGYNPKQTLGSNSVVQIMVQNAFKGATFVISGIDSYQSIRNTNYSTPNANAVIYDKFVPSYVTQSKLVIKKVEVENGQTFEYTLLQPDNKSVDIFKNAIIVSAILGAASITIYTICHIKRRNSNDGI